MRPSAAVLHAPTSSLLPPFRLHFTLRRLHCASLRYLHRSHTNNIITSRKDSFSSIRSASTQQPVSAVFPGGYRRPEIKVPSILLYVDPADVVPGGETLDIIDKAVSEAVSIVVLNGCNVASGKQLYEAACLIKSVVRERAYFLIEERVDIASAVNASGVVLSDQGLPTLVARNMIMDSKPDSVYFPLVARRIETLSPEQASSHFEGADFLLFSPQKRDYTIEGTPKIPVFISNPKGGNSSYSLMEEAANVSFLGGSGLALSLHDLKKYGHETVGRLFEAVSLKENGASMEINSKGALREIELLTAGFVKVEDKEKELVEKEKALMLETINVMRSAAPQMEEISLLVDAVAQIDDPFLLAIVGEFNSGKSTFINALLGEKYLKDGVVPTTNEITFLRHSDMRAGEQERCERHPDGQYICYLPFPILKEINIVDTPGTNVILQRQQRLTEEFVPRADLLMFVLSSDRPLTESEVSFLRYTQQWKKKIVFVLNKSDLYNNSAELEEAVSFVKENVMKLLSTGEATLYPVSSRSALEAKLSSVSIPANPNDRFSDLEEYLYSFLDGSTSAGKERMKLKLETPLRIAERLLSACKTIVKYECIQAKENLESLIETTNSVKNYARKLQTESTLQREKLRSLVDSTRSRVVDAIESTLKLSNLDTAISYVMKGEDAALVPESLQVENDVVGPALSVARSLLGEHVRWLEESNATQAKVFIERFESTGPSLAGAASTVSLDTYESFRRHDKASLSVLDSSSFSAKTFDKEIREVFLGTLGGLGAAGVSASLLTSLLPSTMEDLLALGLCSAGGYFAILRFPSRRDEVVRKLNELSEEIGKQMEEAMRRDFEETARKMEDFVKTIGQPYIDAAQRRVDGLMAVQDDIALLEKRITSLQVQIQNLHVS